MTNSTPLHFQEVLDSKRLSILEKLTYFKQEWFILGWWTALAIIFWHRESIDFDFFISHDIDTEALFQTCLEVFDWQSVMKTYEEKNTLYIIVDEVKISFFTYTHKYIRDMIETPYLNLYSIEDIGAMKLWAIQNRATNKDYVDLYYIIHNIWLGQLLEIFFEKFWYIITQSYLLKSLVYFEDIIEEPLILKDSNLDFRQVKNYLEEAIQKV